jgi:hypothetical protein
MACQIWAHFFLHEIEISGNTGFWHNPQWNHIYTITAILKKSSEHETVENGISMGP